jgi:hypothetical protein
MPKEKAMSNVAFSDVIEGIERSRATIYSIIPGIRFLGFSKKEQLERSKKSVENIRSAVGWRENPTVVREFQESTAETITAGQTAMFKVAELSGGKTGFVEKPEDAERVYADIFKLISNRYVVGYYPTNRQADGKRRQVKIEVRGHPEYVVLGRKVYLPK